MIPGKYQRDEETDPKEDGHAANEAGRPPEVIGHESEDFEDEPRSGNVRDDPLGDPTLLQILDKGSHWTSIAYWMNALRQLQANKTRSSGL